MELIAEVISKFTFYFTFVYPLLYAKGFVSNNKAFKIFTFYLIAIAVIQLFSKLVIKVWDFESNLFVSHYYFIAQFILLSWFYHQLLNARLVFYLLGITLVFIFYQYTEDPSMYYRYNSLGMLITHLILVVYALVYMYRSLGGVKQFTIVNVGVFIYLLSSALIFASGNLVLDINIPETFSALLIYINKFLFLVFQILIFTEWYRNYRKPNTVLNS